MRSAASRLASMRKKVAHICPTCTNPFKAIKKAIYCSNACSQKAKYQRKIAKKE